MNVRIPKEIKDLSPGELHRIEGYFDKLYYEKYSKALERDGRIALDLYMKMVCITLYDKCGMDEEQITLFLGHHRELFYDQVQRVRTGEQIDYLNTRMNEIFKTNGFPKDFFDKILGKVENTEEKDE